MSITARVEHPNTPETDAQTRVWHIVVDEDGTEHHEYARCPMDAIEMFRKRQKESDSLS